MRIRREGPGTEDEEPAGTPPGTREPSDSAPPQRAEITELLVNWSHGDRGALERLIPLVYQECRRMAALQLGRERVAHTLSPTALVHELYLRLIDQRSATWQNRAHFFGVAAGLMRRILVDHARSRAAQKRGGRQLFVTLTDNLEPEAAGADNTTAADILALDEALGRLGARDPDQRHLVELRFFAGLTVDETAHVLGRSPRTVKREWQLARAWLFRELYPDAAAGSAADTSPSR
jgi:RNA polymerase sigma-70 factor, ECF subfamily